MTTLQRMRAEKQPRASRNTNWSLHLTAQVSRIRKITCHEEILFHEEPPTAWPFASLGSEPTCALVGKTAQCSACAVAPTAPTATALCPETGARVSLMCGNSSKLLVITPINASSKNKGDGLGVIKAALTLHLACAKAGAPPVSQGHQRGALLISDRPRRDGKPEPSLLFCRLAVCCDSPAVGAVVTGAITVVHLLSPRLPLPPFLSVTLHLRNGLQDNRNDSMTSFCRGEFGAPGR